MIQRQDWVWLLAINAIANVAVEAAFREHSARPQWLGVLGGAWPGFIVSTTISTLCLLVHPRLTPILFNRLGPWIRWLILIVTLVVLVSILLHGMFATGALAHLDRWRTIRKRGRARSG